MPLFEDHNAIFIHIPKTGGTTVLRMLGLEAGERKDIFYHTDVDYEYYHATAQLIKSTRPDRYKSAYKFAVVRNPYDRLVSEFCWKKQDGDARIVEVKKSGMNFGDFVHFLFDRFDRIQHRIHKEKSHFMPQNQFVLDDVEVFRYERINECLEFLNRKFGVPVPTQRHNKTEHPHFETYYDSTLRDKVYDMYYADFKLFGYDR